MAQRKPQINFQVNPKLKAVYEAAAAIEGLNTTRLCAAGFLYMLENAKARTAALDRLMEFESMNFDPKDEKKVAEFLRRLRDSGTGTRRTEGRKS